MERKSVPVFNPDRFRQNLVGGNAGYRPFTAVECTPTNGGKPSVSSQLSDLSNNPDVDTVLK
ncbi:hypothetical protein, partial [Methylomonas koyamae]|uniref:hypothetical protein n=1 Tax=Methylomonas koyamae TaxID=702114 RepID=UPI001E385FC9